MLLFPEKVREKYFAHYKLTLILASLNNVLIFLLWKNKVT